MSKVEGCGEDSSSRATNAKVLDTEGAVVGLVLNVRDHPNGQRIWLAQVDLGNGDPVQVVFGGQRRLRQGELVPAAPPGTKVLVESVGLQVKKMRSRRYRGERSYGMLCSLDELGWGGGGPDEVATLLHLEPGDPLDEVPVEQRWDVLPERLRPFLRAYRHRPATAMAGGK